MELTEEHAHPAVSASTVPVGPRFRPVQAFRRPQLGVMHEQIAPATPGTGVLLVILVKHAQDVQPGTIVKRGLSHRAHPTSTLDRCSPPHRPHVHALPGILEPLRVVLSVARASGRVRIQT